MHHKLITKQHNLVPVQTESFYSNKINVTWNWIIVYQRVENIFGNGENAGDKHFLLFPQCFHDAYFSEILWHTTFARAKLQL